MRNAAFWFLSILLHATLIAALLLATTLVTTPPKHRDLVDLSLDEPPPGASPSALAEAAGPRRSTAPTGRPAKTKNLARFFPSETETWRNFERQQQTEPVFNDEVEIRQAWTDAWSYSPDPSYHSKFSARDHRREAFYAEAARRIEDHLEDRGLLAEYNHSGIVYLKFALRPDGSVDGSTLSAAAADPVVKVLSARAVRRGLADAFPLKLRLDDKKEIWMTARFHWTPPSGCRELAPRAGPFLTFCRSSGEARPDFSTAGRLAARAKILASATGPFGWAEEFDKQRKMEWRHDTQFDPFERELRDPDADL